MPISAEWEPAPAGRDGTLCPTHARHSGRTANFRTCRKGSPADPRRAAVRRRNRCSRTPGVRSGPGQNSRLSHSGLSFHCGYRWRIRLGRRNAGFSDSQGIPSCPSSGPEACRRLSPTEPVATQTPTSQAGATLTSAILLHMLPMSAQCDYNANHSGGYCRPLRNP